MKYGFLVSATSPRFLSLHWGIIFTNRCLGVGFSVKLCQQFVKTIQLLQPLKFVCYGVCTFHGDIGSLISGMLKVKTVFFGANVSFRHHGLLQLRNAELERSSNEKDFYIYVTRLFTHSDETSTLWKRFLAFIECVSPLRTTELGFSSCFTEETNLAPVLNYAFRS